METDQPATRGSFGPLLKRFRLAAGLSQEALAERAGLSWRTVSDLERGVKHGPRGTTLRLLTEALPLSAEERTALWASAYPQDAVAAEPAQPSMQSPPAVPTNLPLALTSFVGRERALARVRDPVLAMLQRSGLAATIGKAHIYHMVDEGVQDYLTSIAHT